MPWKNGRGETLEIARDPSEPYLWRVSSAKIEETAPFSSFPGYDRKLVVLDGPGIRLSDCTIDPLVVFPFLGEDAGNCEVTEPCRDFNVFVLRGKARVNVHVSISQAGEEVRFPYEGDEHFVFGVSGQLEFLDQNTDQGGTLLPNESIWVTRPPKTNLLNLRAKAKGGQAVCLWVVITVG